MPASASATAPPTAPPVPTDDDDEVVMRLPVHLRSADPRTPLCLFQYPLRPRWRPYGLDHVHEARVRPEQRRVELTLGNECSPEHFDEDSPSPLTSISLASTTTSANRQYAVGMLRTGPDGSPVSLSLMPLATTVQLRPSFALLDQADGEPSGRTPPRSAGGRSAAGDEPMAESSVHGASEVGGDDDEAAEHADAAGGGDGGGGPTVAPLFRPAQTEREIEARRSSHAYLVEQREAEPWSQATLHGPDQPESVAVRDRCFGPVSAS